MKCHLSFLVLLPAILLSIPAQATTYRVCHDGTGDFLTIQEAIDAASDQYSDHDTVLVCQGNYPEDLLVEDKSVHIFSEDGAQHTTISGSFEIIGHSYSDGGTLDGFTITDTVSKVYSGFDGPRFTLGGCTLLGPFEFEIVCLPEDFVLTGCEFHSYVRIHEHHATYGEGGCQVLNCTFLGADLITDQVDRPYVTDCVFNSGGIYVVNGDGPWIEGNELEGGGVWVTVSDAYPFILGNSVSSATTGIYVEALLHWERSYVRENLVVACSLGIHIVKGSPRISGNRVESCSVGMDLNPWGHCEVAENVVWACADGIVFGECGIELPRFVRNTVAGCTGDGLRISDLGGSLEGQLTANLVAHNGTGITLPTDADTAAFTIQCNDVWDCSGGNWIGFGDLTGIRNNFSADPRLCDLATGDLTLTSDSPCLPGYHPDGANCGVVGAHSVGCPLVTVEHPELPPKGSGLELLAPNPFSCSTSITYEIGRDPGRSAVQLGIYDPAGRLVKTLNDSAQAAGIYTVRWDGTNEADVPIAGGVFFCQLKVNGMTHTRRIILVR